MARRLEQQPRLPRLLVCAAQHTDNARHVQLWAGGCGAAVPEDMPGIRGRQWPCGASNGGHGERRRTPPPPPGRRYTISEEAQTTAGTGPGPTPGAAPQARESGRNPPPLAKRILRSRSDLWFSSVCGVHACVSWHTAVFAFEPARQTGFALRDNLVQTWPVDFAAFARGSICCTFIDSVPLIEIPRATSTVEMAPSVLMDRRKEWEDTFVKKFGVPVNGEVGLPKMVGPFCVMAQCSLDVEGVGFVKSAPPPAPAPELQVLKKLVEDERMAMEGLRKELAEVSAKSEAAVKRKMAGVPPLSKAELLKVRELDAKPQWVYASLLALSTLLWRREVPAHEYVTRFRDKDKFTDVTLDDLAPVMDSDAADTEVWCLESMNDDEMDRLKAFVLAVWTFTVTCPRIEVKGVLTPKERLTSKRRKTTSPICWRDRKAVWGPRRKRWWHAGWWP